MPNTSTRESNPRSQAPPPRVRLTTADRIRGVEQGLQSLIARLLRSEETRERLLRFVPDAVRDQVQNGVDLDCGEREVTVLFADLHGFTGFSEPLGADEVFQVLSGYTRCVSRQVHRHAGTIVDFNGDGMMAVFGALHDLEQKERAAVASARAIVHELQRWKDPSGRRLPVGVGVATGKAYVGTIQTSDRVVWSAVGNTTNLASRLQKLAGELQSPIVVDACTRRRAGILAGDFLCHPGTEVRGRRSPLDVWVLPAAPCAAAAAS